MSRFVAWRLFQAVPVLFVSSVLIFLLLHLAPGDPIKMLTSPQMKPEDVRRLRARYALDQPLPVQYALWLGRVVRGDLGVSVTTNLPVSDILWRRFGNTIRLTTISLAIAITGGLTLGILAATHRNSVFDIMSMFVSVVGFSVPPFWLGLMLTLVFSVNLRLLPAGGGDSNLHLVLPSISLGWSYTALIARMTRTSMLEVLEQDYVRAARAKGLTELRVVSVHALRNAIIPVVTVIGLSFGGLLAGAAVTESVFAWPGIGSLLVQSILKRDFPIVQGTVLLTAFTYLLANLIVDILYCYFDPRIKVS